MADLDVYLADNVQAWELRKDGRYEQLRPTGGSRHNAGTVEAASPARRGVLSSELDSRLRARNRGRAAKPSSCSRSAAVSGLSSSHPRGNSSSRDVLAGREADRRQIRGTAAAIQQHREPQQHDKLEHRLTPRTRQLVEERIVELASVQGNEACEQLLLEPDEARQVGVRDEVAAVMVITGVRDDRGRPRAASRPKQAADDSADPSSCHPRATCSSNTAAVDSTRAACSRSTW